jgi:hypothetical protein
MSARRFPIRRALFTLAAAASLAGCAVEATPVYYDGPVYSAPVACCWVGWRGGSRRGEHEIRMAVLPVHNAELGAHPRGWSPK